MYEAEAVIDTRRGVIEALNTVAPLSVEGGEKKVYAECVVGYKVYTLHPAESLL